MSTPVLGFCAYASGSGKTTMLTKLIPLLVEAGLRISVIKHAHHGFEIEQPHKDSYRLRASGAVQTLISSNRQCALITDFSRTGEPEPSLQRLLQHMDASLADLILVEGYKQAVIPKIEIYRPALKQPLLAEHDAHIIAVAADGAVDTTLPVLDLNNPVNISNFVQAWLKQAR